MLTTLKNSDSSTVQDSQGHNTRELSFLRTSLNPDLLGRFGRYEVLEPVGRGGMGIVLKARDPLLNNIVAIKVLDPHFAGSEIARKRFAREARAAAAINHNNVIVIHGVAERDGLPYLVMPYIPGGTLADRIRKIGPLELLDALRIGMQIASGLAAAHAQGVVHRDIKPANILLEEGLERVKITDFGLAQVVDDASLTQSGIVTGTPDYMSPEQAQEGPVDYRSDLFSLGSVLYVMCTGQTPFRGATSLAVIRRVCDEQPREIRHINPKVPEWLSQIVKSLHSKHPAGRIQSATEVYDLLGQYLSRLQASLPIDAETSEMIALAATADDTAIEAPTANSRWSRISKWSVDAWKRLRRRGNET
jgi:serine/threonine-protein kinase